MSTRSDIIVKRTDGKYARIYCHFDGYLSGVGKTLVEHYTDQKKAEALVALGDISVLAPSIKKPKGHSYDTKIEGYTVAYGRDRGEKDTHALVYDTLEKAIGDDVNEYTYVWEDGSWKLWAKAPVLTVLTASMVAEDA